MRPWIFLWLCWMFCASLAAQPVDLASPPLGTIRFTAGSLDGEVGFSITPIGNFNGDAIPDYAIGAPSLSQVFIVGVRSTDSQIPLQNLFQTRRGFTVSGRTGSDFGVSLSALGDFNGDGFDDVAIGAPFEGDGGRVYVLGGTNAIRSDFSVENEAPFLLILEGDPGQFFGLSLGQGMNLDGDRFMDLLAADPNVQTFFEDGTLRHGAFQVVYGGETFDPKVQALSDLDPQGGLFIHGGDSLQSNLNFFGKIINRVGDVTGDGIEDMGFFTGVDLITGVGVVRVIPGGQRYTGRWGYEALPFSTVEVAFSMFPISDMLEVSSLLGGDVDGDGAADLICGFLLGNIAGGREPKGAVAVIRGPIAPGAFRSVESLSDPDAAFVGHWQDGSGFGAAAAWRDGMLAIGAPYAKKVFTTPVDTGAVYVLAGRNLRFGMPETRVGEIAASILYGRTGMSLFGANVFLVGDVNQDGVDDLFLSAVGDTDPNGAPVYLAPLLPLSGDANGDARRNGRALFFFATHWRETAESGDSPFNPAGLLQWWNAWQAK